jgi:branched-chain amino acid transport system substrate-binding protein
MRRLNRKSLYLGAALVVVLLLALALAGCGSSTTTAAPTSTSGGATTTAAPDSTSTAPPASSTTAPPASGTIKIGFSGPLTGDGAVVGQDYLTGAKMYLEKINAAGGIKGQQVEIQAEDDVMDPKISTTVAQKLVDAKVVAVLGPLTSGTTIPTLNIYSGAQIAQLTPASNPDVTDPQKNNNNTFVFRVDPDDYAQGGNIGFYCYNTLKMKTAAIINDKQAFGQGVSEQFGAAFEKAGGDRKSTRLNSSH